MYYGLILLSVMIFGGCFALDDLYQRHRGSSIRISMEYALTSALAGLAVLTIINGFRLEYTPFTLLMALMNVLVSSGIHSAPSGRSVPSICPCIRCFPCWAA